MRGIGLDVVIAPEVAEERHVVDIDGFEQRPDIGVVADCHAGPAGIDVTAGSAFRDDRPAASRRR